MKHDLFPNKPKQVERRMRAIRASVPWRITAPLRWLVNRFPQLRRLRSWVRPFGTTSDPDSVAPTNQFDADPIPPRWPGTPAPAASIRQQLDAAIQRRSGGAPH